MWSVILMNCCSLQPTSSTKPFIPHTVWVRADKVDILFVKMCVIFWETCKLIIYNIQQVRKGRKAISTAKLLNIFAVCYCYNLSDLFLYNRTKTWLVIIAASWFPSCQRSRLVASYKWFSIIFSAVWQDAPNHAYVISFASLPFSQTLLH